MFSVEIPFSIPCRMYTSAMMCFSFASGSFAVASTSIAVGNLSGGLGYFSVLVGDLNLNSLEPDSTIKGSTSLGTLTETLSYNPIIDGLSRGPTPYSFVVRYPPGTAAPYVTVGVTVTTTSGYVLTSAINVPLQQLVIATTSLPPGNHLVAYAPVTLTATGGTAPYTWTSGSLPVGLTSVRAVLFQVLHKLREYILHQSR